jgi:hypothetical protein
MKKVGPLKYILMWHLDLYTKIFLNMLYFKNMWLV